MTRFPLAQRMVLDYLGHLCRPGAQFASHHLQPLEHFMYRRWMRGEDIEEWSRRVAAANSLLERAFDERTSEFGPLWNQLADSAGNTLIDVNRLAPVAWRSGTADNPDARFRPLRELYASTYEGIYRAEAAVFVAADAVLSGGDPHAFVDGDGKVHASELERLESRRDLPPGLLTEGANNHLRNSIAHSLYEVLSEDQIRMWDRRPRGGPLTWGPEEFSHTEFHGTVFTFLSTCEALIAAKLIFDVNNNRVLRERGFLTHEPRRFRLDVARLRLDQYADLLGFECLGAEEGDDNTLRVQLKVHGERDEHPAQILASGPGGVAAFVEDVETRDVPIRLQVYTFVQHTWQLYETYDQFVIEVVDSDEAGLGRLVVDADQLLPLRDMAWSADETREKLTEDTLPDDPMPVTIRSVPRRV